MEMSNTLYELAQKVILQLEKNGFSESVISRHSKTYDSLSVFCRKNGIEFYDEYVGQSFLRQLQDQIPPLKEQTLKLKKSHIRRLNMPVEEMQQVHYGRCPTEYASSCHDAVLIEYENYLIAAGKANKNIRSRIHAVSRFFNHIEQQGCLELRNLTAQNIYVAFRSCTDKIGFRRLVGSFLKYAYKYGLITNDLFQYMPKVQYHKAVPSVYSKEEIEILLAAVNRNTHKGKRDYAILLMAARLGLRASDIAAITFDSLCFIDSKIRVIQKKTRQPLTLPFLDELQVAVSDYLDNSRPESAEHHIFLNCNGSKPISAANIGKITEIYFNVAGIDCANKRKGSHALRASLATALLDEGNDCATIQQVLGHTEITSTKSYIKANAELLRSCALNVPPLSKNFLMLISGGSMQ